MNHRDPVAFKWFIVIWMEIKAEQYNRNVDKGEY